MDFIFGFLVLLVFGVVAWCVASEGAWGAGLTFLAVLFASLLAMNFFEPLAGMIDENGGDFLRDYSDLLALTGLFALFVFLARAGGDYLAPIDLEMDGHVYQAARWIFALSAGYTTTAFLLTALHTAPLPREFIGFKPERKNLLDMAAPDRQWLGFVQHVSEKVLPTGTVFDGGMPPDLAANFKDSPDHRYWPSFPIRYATRRDELASGTSTKKFIPAPTTTPSGSMGGGGNTNASF